MKLLASTPSRTAFAAGLVAVCAAMEKVAADGGPSVGPWRSGLDHHLKSLYKMMYGVHVRDSAWVSSMVRKHKLSIAAETKKGRPGPAAGRASSGAIREHIVPCKVLANICATSTDGDELIRRLHAVWKYGACAYIHPREDEALTAAGLRSRMPSDWNEGDDPRARDREAGIELPKPI
jgi:hypothetical protein